MVIVNSSFGKIWRWVTSPVFISVVLFGLAFVPRLLNLDQFLTADEFLWVDRSKNFLAALTNPEYRCETDVEKWQGVTQGLACTLRTGHPGVTTMWTGSFGLAVAWLARGRSQSLHQFVTDVSTNPLDASLIAPERFATVLLTSVWVVVLFWWVRRLVGGRMALVAALLLALSPFHVALSRVIHHDALSTTFVTLSALAALIYWGQNGGRRWLVVSGLLAGFGFLSKSPAMYLMPFIALTGLWFTVARTRRDSAGRFAPALARRLLRRTIPDGLLWFALAVAVVFAFWPAMWVTPREALEMVFVVGSKYATGGHAKGNYFLGQVSSDPGALFYPVTWAYRTTPLVMLGLAVALAAGVAVWLRRGRGSARYAGFFKYLPLMLLFVAGYYLLMTWGEKKQDRYFLPAYPWANFIAAGGLVMLFDGLLVGLKRWLSPATRWAGGAFLPALLVVGLNGYLVATNFPYYFTYYNPALGGITAAAKNITIGWGEGMDEAAAYLNAHMNPTSNRVSSWYESTFAPYYLGPTISYSKEKGKALAGNYVIFYINQVQRVFPDSYLFDFIANRNTPEYVVNLHGQDYAWIYPSLGIDHYVTDQTYTGIGALLAWEWTIGDVPLPPGETIVFDLYWEFLGKKAGEPFFVRLLDAQGRVWAEGQSAPVESANPPPDEWRYGQIIYERGFLQIPHGMPPGVYRVAWGIYTDAPAVTSGELPFTPEKGDDWVTVAHRAYPKFNLPPGAIEIRQPLGNSLVLLGAGLPAGPIAAGETLPVELTWQVTQPLPADATVHVALLDSAGQAAQAWFDLSLAETFNPADTVWQPGDVVTTRWSLDLLPDVPPGEYRLDLVWPDDVQQTVPAGEVTVR
ncbi:MAG: hypothetical protein D6768_08760 [Chloroflexi bacterium]|nr:MAG: hypothetical protein D6768_08760 [Chloroflexota bacterium]